MPHYVKYHKIRLLHLNQDLDSPSVLKVLMVMKAPQKKEKKRKTYKRQEEMLVKERTGERKKGE